MSVHIKYFKMMEVVKLFLVISIAIQLTLSELMEMSCDEILATEYYERYFGTKCTISGISADSSSTFVIRSANNYDYSKIIQEVEFSRSQLYDMPREIFGTFQFLKKVSANSCGIEDLHKSNFNYASALQELRLRANKIKKLPNGVFSSMQSLENLDLTANIISEIETNAFINLKNLEFLTLSDNKISSLNEQVFKDLPSLISIRLDSNKLQIINENLFNYNLNLSEIRLDSNEIAVINGNAFGNLRKLKILNLGSNRLQEIDIANTVLERLWIPYNKLNSLIVNQNMKSLYAPYNELTELSFNGGGSNSEMLEMKLRRNYISDFSNISSLVKLEILDVSNNPIGALNISSFARMNSLVKLNLEFTNITTNSLTFGTFAHNPNLTQLDLSYNQLKRIDFNIFTSLTQLTHLKIDGNNLTEIPYENIKTHFPKLSLISLYDNDWSCAYLSNMTKQLRALNVIIYVFSKQRVLDSTNVDGIRCHNNKTQHVVWRSPIFDVDAGGDKNSIEEIDKNRKSIFDLSMIKRNFTNLWIHIYEIEESNEKFKKEFKGFKEGIELMKTSTLNSKSEKSNINNDVIVKSEISNIKDFLGLMFAVMMIFMLMAIAKFAKVFFSRQQFYYPSDTFRRSTATIQTTMEHVM